MESFERDKCFSATIESARVKVLSQELLGVKMEQTPSCVECANSLWDAHSVTKTASKVKEGIGNALMAVFGRATDALKQKLSIIEIELKDFLKWVWTQI